ncbi:hypothetical protein SLS56_002075 [Neofusicoccum ribis]|uniref:EamA domain-containing protein n=1 Tax=Neofusicoccum ribis TaxID=45134 RepID=A0ABR3T5Y5_9PEZI
MDVFYGYTFGTAGWLTLQAVPLIASPTIIAAMLSPQVRDATSFTLITLGIMTVLLTGSVPLSSRLSSPAGGATTDPDDPKAPYALPTLTVTTLYHSAAAFYMYGMWTETGVSSFAFGVTGSTTLAAVGIWCILFASSDGRISRKTGADKRTSGWPFKNAEADKRKKGKKSI